MKCLLIGHRTLQLVKGTVPTSVCLGRTFLAKVFLKLHETIGISGISGTKLLVHCGRDKFNQYVSKHPLCVGTDEKRQVIVFQKFKVREGR